jgi:hypothetical protein
VAFENVTFRYKEGQDVLKDFNLRVYPGEHIAFSRADGRRQVHHRQPDLPLLRAERGGAAH